MVFHCIISREKGDHYYIQTQHKDLFPLQSYSKKTLRKNVPKSARKYKRNVFMPPGHPIILLKSNYFNMAAVSIKRSIRFPSIVLVQDLYILIHSTSFRCRIYLNHCAIRFIKIMASKVNFVDIRIYNIYRRRKSRR